MDIKEVRNNIFLRDGNKCCICGSTELLCLDHLLPKPTYQIHEVSNLMTLCLKCNFQKGVAILSKETISDRQQYINKANAIFSDKMISEMNIVLNEYFSTPRKKRKKDRDYVLWGKGRDRRKVWELLNEINMKNNIK